MKILFTSAESRKCFDIFNILKPKLKNVLLSSNMSFLNRCLLSVVYLQRVYKTEKIFIDIKQSNIQAKIFGIEESDIEKIYWHQLEHLSLVPDKEAFRSTVDKKILSENAAMLGIKAPKTVLASQMTRSNLTGRVVIKPISGKGSEGVKFFNTANDAAMYVESLEKSHNFIAQESIGTNPVIAGCFLFKKGQIISYYGHERLRTYPIDGGVTVSSVSHTNIEIKRLGERLLGPLQWDGLAMIEFMWSDKLGDYQLIEVNPRAWGSIMLSECCGSNMLLNYVNLLLERPLVASSPQDNCRIGWLIPFDLLNLVKGRINLSDLSYNNNKHECSINITYAGFVQSPLFHMFQITRFTKILKKFFPND